VTDIKESAEQAHIASRALGVSNVTTRNSALESFARGIEHAALMLLARNAEDVKNAEAKGISRALIGRLKLSDSKIHQMVASVRQVIGLDDPTGRVLRHTLLDDGLDLQQVTVPFGTIAAIIESRPDAVVQLISLALKSGNALVVKAGHEANSTVAAIEQLVRRSLIEHELPEGCVTVVYGREAVAALLGMNGRIDLIVPRGSKELIQYVQGNTCIPVIGHAEGICHIYVDAEADWEMATRIILDAKTQAPSACNAVETVLIHRSVEDFVPRLAMSLMKAQVKIRGCNVTARLAAGIAVDVITDEREWATEYGDSTIAVKVVESLDEAMTHIARFGSGHTDCILTSNPETARRFLREVDSAGVFHNASTRFADGFRYGLGAEVGISTGKLPPRGPVGLDGLVTYKWLLHGSGQCAASYTGENAKPFRHQQY